MAGSGQEPRKQHHETTTSPGKPHEATGKPHELSVGGRQHKSGARRYRESLTRRQQESEAGKQQESSSGSTLGKAQDDPSEDTTGCTAARNVNFGGTSLSKSSAISFKGNPDDIVQM